MSYGGNWWGDNLGKMPKNCMKITKSAFLGQSIEGARWLRWGMGGKPIFRVVGGSSPQSPPPPIRANPVYRNHFVLVLNINRHINKGSK